MEHVVPGTLRRLRATDIISIAGLAAATRGQEYARVGAVQATRRQAARLSGVVNHASPSEDGRAEDSASSTLEGSQHSYHVTVELQGAMQWESTCTCDSLTLSLCEHGAALLYEWLAHPGAFVVPAPTPAPNAREEGTEFSPEVLEGEQPSPSLAETPRGNNTSRTTNLQYTLVPVATLGEILPQLGISELRAMARSYDITTNNMSKPQLADELLSATTRPEAVRKVAATLEKAQRQLLAAICLFGSTISDEELRGLYERFALGQPAQYQRVLAELQNRALLFRTSLNSSSLARAIQGGSAQEIGWFVPAEIRNALRVTVPMTPYAFPQGEQAEQGEQPRARRMEPLRLLSELLLVARALDGIPVGENAEWLDISDVIQAEFTGTTRTSDSPLNDGAFTISGTSELPPESLIDLLYERLPRPRPFLRYALRLLRLADLVRRDPTTGTQIRASDELPNMLLGERRIDIAHNLFTLWLKHSSIDELIRLREVGVHLRCRASSRHQPVLRPGELEGENGEARRMLLALLAQATQEQWTNFAAFARFIYRLNPLFLQRRQRYFASPHWWLEQREGRALKPLQANDWQRAEYHYIAQCIQGPLYWWGICDINTTPDGKLLAFRLTPLANWLLKDGPPPPELERVRQRRLAHVMEITDTQELRVPAHPSLWSIVKVLEHFTTARTPQDSMLCYRLTPEALSGALRQGRDMEELFRILHQVARREPALTETLEEIIARLERLRKSYGRARLYAHIPLLGVADGIVMRELEATTTLKEQTTRVLNPTTVVLRQGGIERLIDELKRRDNPPLVHERVVDETE